ncbi:MAG: ATP-binding cassette domain-containing protein, partial [Planctomycetes bacterium]|nr:ATP-binding cassette domain-containing protein [Planctomycetota bacterium]
MNKENFILQATELYKTYHLGKANVDVLEGVDLAINKGEFIAIVGASGSGKSTLLHILGTLDRSDKGEVSFAGQNLAKLKMRKLNKFRNKTIGFVFQFYH